MNAFIEKKRQRVRPTLTMAAEALGIMLHYFFFFAGLWAFFLLLGALMILAATPDALQSARMAILITQFKPGYQLFCCFCLGSISLAFWHWAHSSIHRKGIS